jgi:hypothetical protein
MDEDDATRKMILRVQMEDLASIWTLSASSAIDDAELDADVALRLYRQELRAAEQQNDDKGSAQAVAQDELRQRDAVLADREAARRLFLELNPNEPLPELTKDNQSAHTALSTFGKALLNTEVSPTPEPCQSSGQSVPPSSSSLVSQRTALSSASVKRSASHLDTVDEPSPKKQASERKNPAVGLSAALSGSLFQRAHLGSTHGAHASPDGPSLISSSHISISASHKRPAEDYDSVVPSTKKQKILAEDSSFVHGTTQSTSEPASAVSGPASSENSASSMFGLIGNPTRQIAEAPRFGQTATPGRWSTPRSSLSPKDGRRNDRDASTTDSEKPEPQELPTSRQPVAPGQQLAAEQFQSSEVECVACCTEASRNRSHTNSCSHSYCSRCIKRLSKKAVHDDSLWPPQCCKAEMPIEEIECLLPEDLIILVRARQVEMGVPILDRTYCVDCSAFIPQDRIHERTALCHSCWTSTCSECKEKAHVGDCQNKLEQHIKDLETLAEREGWKKCSTCLMIVEHNTGCNHMT